MARYIVVHTVWWDMADTMFDVDKNTFISTIPAVLKLCMCGDDLIWIRHINHLPKALLLNNLGMSPQEVESTLYPPPSLIPF